jgi:hypothetical protein
MPGRQPPTPPPRPRNPGLLGPREWREWYEWLTSDQTPREEAVWASRLAGYAWETHDPAERDMLFDRMARQRADVEEAARQHAARRRGGLQRAKPGQVFGELIARANAAVLRDRPTRISRPAWAMIRNAESCRRLIQAPPPLPITVWPRGGGELCYRLHGEDPTRPPQSVRWPTFRTYVSRLNPARRPRKKTTRRPEI